MFSDVASGDEVVDPAPAEDAAAVAGGLMFIVDDMGVRR